MTNQKNIPGIYNWCDKWCERCHLTSKCLLFEREGLADEEKDITNETFWNNLNASFAEAAELLQENAENFGIEFNAPTPEEIQESVQDYEIKQLLIDAHPLSKLSDQYPSKIKKWMDKYVTQINFGENIKDVNSGLNTEKSQLSIKDAYEVISWYQYMVYIKCNRALRDRQMDEEFDEDLPEEEKSHNGSAKVASIAIDRSIQSWSLLMTFIPEQESSILEILSLLQKISKLLHATFPHLNKFIRPGFDDI